MNYKFPNALRKIFLYSLIFVLNVSQLAATKGYNLDTGQEEDIDDNTYITNALYIRNIPDNIKNKIKVFIKEENFLRGNAKKLDETNFCRLFIGIVHGNSEIENIKFLENNISDRIYLSGNTPKASIGTQEEKRENPLFDIRTKSIGFGEGHISKEVKIIQRKQHTEEPVETFLNYLVTNKNNLSSDSKEMKLIADKASEKLQELKEFRKDLEESKEKIKEDILNSAYSLINDINQSIALKDYNLHLVETKYSKNPEEIPQKNIKEARKIIFENTKNRDKNDLFTTPFFSLNCAEQLFSYDCKSYMDEFTYEIANELKKIRDTAPLSDTTNVLFHLHSTKRPCITCITGFIGHIENGLISEIFDRIKVEVGNGIQLKFLISYHEHYKDANDVNLFIPVIDDYNDLNERKLGLIYFKPITESTVDPFEVDMDLGLFGDNDINF